jgi:hypothetical protein
MLYAVQGTAPERNNSLTLSMQLVELCKASGRCGSGGDCDGLQDYFPTAPLAFKHIKDNSRRRSARLQPETAEDMQDHTYCARLARSRTVIQVSLERREHHGSYEVTVAGRTLSQSSICFGLLFSGRRPQRRHRVLALSRKANERKLMFALGRAPFEFVDSNRVETPRISAVV